MTTISEFVQQLKSMFPAVKFYNGAIDKSAKQCVGVYARGNAAAVRAIGGQSSYNTLPVSILVHWTEDSNLCEITANSLYTALYESSMLVIGGKRVIDIVLLDSCPINVDRDANNIVEMVIRLNIVYEREVL